MRLQDYSKQVSKVIAQRNFSYVVVLVTLLSNLLLVWKVLGEHDRIILIPQNDLSKRIIFDGKKISDDYLIDWSSSILSDLLTVNRHTVAIKNKKFLELASTSEHLKEVVKKNADRIKRDGVSTVFYPKKFHIDHEKKKVFVTGTFMAFFGRDQAPVVKENTYALGWRESSTGLVLIESLETGEQK